MARRQNLDEGVDMRADGVRYVCVTSLIKVFIFFEDSHIGGLTPLFMISRDCIYTKKNLLVL